MPWGAAAPPAAAEVIATTVGRIASPNFIFFKPFRSDYRSILRAPLPPDHNA